MTTKKKTAPKKKAAAKKTKPQVKKLKEEELNEDIAVETTEDVVEAPEVANTSSADHPEQSIGELLARARKDKKKTLDRIAKDLRIHSEKLKALEEENFAVLPGRAYVLGFLKSYATYLELNADHVVELYKRYHSDTEFKKNYTLPKAPPRRTPNKQILWIAGLLALVIYVTWYITSSPSSTVDQAVLDEKAAQSVAAGLNGEAEGTGENAANITVDPELEASLLEWAGADYEAVPEAPVTPQVEAVADIEKDAATQTVAASQTAVLVAKSENWVQVIQGNGVSLLSKVMAAGEEFEFEVKEGVTITTGNAGALMLKSDDENISLGKNGEVLQNKALLEYF